jgi:hypothetical protein
VRAGPHEQVARRSGDGLDAPVGTTERVEDDEKTKRASPPR